MWTTQFAETAEQPHQRNVSTHSPVGSHQALKYSALSIALWLPHSHPMQDLRRLVRYSLGDSLEADALSELNPQSSESADVIEARDPH